LWIDDGAGGIQENETMIESEKPITPAEINSAYDTATHSRLTWSACEAVLIRAEDDLKRAESNAVNAGALADLKNEMQRESKLREVCALEHAKLMAAQIDAIEARGKFEANRMEIERIEIHLRLMEIERA